jgi:hypothetical protein
MKKLVILGALVIAGCASAGASSQASSQAPELESWMRAHCPDGRGVRLDSGEAHAVIACEDLRAGILVDDGARAQAELLLALDLGGALSGAGEAVGEAREPFSPVGAACSVITLALGLIFNWPGGHHGCDDPRAENRGACRAATAGGSIGLGIACWFI